MGHFGLPGPFIGQILAYKREIGLFGPWALSGALYRYIGLFIGEIGHIWPYWPKKPPILCDFGPWALDRALYRYRALSSLISEESSLISEDMPG